MNIINLAIALAIIILFGFSFVYFKCGEDIGMGKQLGGGLGMGNGVIKSMQNIDSILKAF